MFKIFQNVQYNVVQHKKYVKEMIKLYKKLDEDSFRESFKNAMMYLFTFGDTNASVDHIIQFVATFCTSLDDEEDFLLFIFNIIFNMQRLQNTRGAVRCRAALALQRLNPMEPDDEVTRAYRFHMSCDPSSSVSRMASSYEFAEERETFGSGLLMAMAVEVTPHGSLNILGDQVVLERSGSCQLRRWCPTSIEVDETLEFLDEGAATSAAASGNDEASFPPNTEDSDDGQFFESSPPEAVLGDSGSEVDEEENLTLEELQQLLQDDEEEEEDKRAALNEQFLWGDDVTTFRGEKSAFREEAGPKIEGTRLLELFTQIWDLPVMDMIVGEINKYAQRTIDTAVETDTLPPSSRLHGWVKKS